MHPNVDTLMSIKGESCLFLNCDPDHMVHVLGSITVYNVGLESPSVILKIDLALTCSTVDP